MNIHDLLSFQFWLIVHVSWILVSVFNFHRRNQVQEARTSNIRILTITNAESQQIFHLANWNM